MHADQTIISRDASGSPHHGVFEIELTASPNCADPYFEVELRVIFTRPDDSEVEVDGFYDGGRVFRARAYCDAVGIWGWSAVSDDPELHGQSGSFVVSGSSLKGKLRRHPDDSHQFAYDNGEWFLHIGDTGYRYVADTEPEWQVYIDQAAAVGMTRIRTWFCRERGDVQVLFDEDRRGLNLPYWQEIDRRMSYALENHPQVIFTLIPYGEDTEEIVRYGLGDKVSRLVARYAQARFSSFANVIWCISNDREIIRDGELKGRRVPWKTIDQMGRDMAGREPWSSLLTNHQSRFSGYDFVDAEWSDIVTLEDIDQVSGELILEYRACGDDPVINDEDRYETYRNPIHSRYFFRRLMWVSLLSGGHATYGGLRTFEPYDGELKGMQGYADAVAAGKLEGGADDFAHIHQFFADSGLTLVGMTPDDRIAGSNPQRWKCIHAEGIFIFYLANPTGDEPESDGEADVVPSVTLRLPEDDFTVEWFDPAEGCWERAVGVEGGTRMLRAPGPGDWVLLLRRERE